MGKNRWYLVILAFACIAGQTARKEIKADPQTRHSEEIDLEAAAPIFEPKEEWKSAAKRSMEGPQQTAMIRKSAAQRAVEAEQQMAL